MSELAEAYIEERVSLGAAGLAPSTELQARLTELCASAQRAFPELRVPPSVFVRRLARSAQRVAPELGGVPDLMFEDLYLACAAEAADPNAPRVIKDRYGGLVQAAVAPIARDAKDDVEQQLWDMLLVGSPEAPAKLLTYSGQGPLGRWLQVAAQRTALMLRRSDQAENRARESAAAEAIAMEVHPEAAILKQRYRAEFEDAMRQAVSELEQRERIVMRLYVVGNVTVESIAKMYGVSQSTASRWLAQARARIGDRLQELLRARLRLTASEIQSLAGLVASQLDLTMSRLLQTRV